MTVVIVETRGNEPHPASIQALALAQSLGDPVTAVVAGTGLEPVVARLTQLDLDHIVAFEHESLQAGASEPLVHVLAEWIRDTGPELVIASHSYAARDFAPRLAARLDRPLVTDCVAIRAAHTGRVFTRPVFQGRLVADVMLDGPTPHLATVQIGAAHALEPRPASAPPRQSTVRPSLDATALAVVVEPPTHRDDETTDLTRAKRIVAAGRGIADARHITLIEALAAALDADVAASRPVCDAGWLPLDRQVGSSGQTVAPDLYVAVGISGAIQHVVGMKDAKTVVAINMDPHAPIFDVADFGIVGDLFEVVPAIVAALRGTPDPRA